MQGKIVFFNLQNDGALILLYYDMSLSIEMIFNDYIVSHNIGIFILLVVIHKIYIAQYFD